MDPVHDQSYDERRRRVRRAYARRQVARRDFFFVECPHCARMIPTKDRGFVPPHTYGGDPTASCPATRLLEVPLA